MVSELCAPEPGQHVELLTGPWQDVGVDLMGPLPTGESLLVVVDYYSHFYKVCLLWSTTIDKVIGFLGPVFTRHVQCEIRQKTTVCSQISRSSTELYTKPNHRYGRRVMEMQKKNA